MKLVVLGTAGYHPNEHRHTTCLMIPEAGIIFDAGTSFFRVPRYLVTDTVDIYLTHAHLDHVVGLTYLLDIFHERPLAEVRVHAEASKLSTIREHLFSPHLFPVEPPYVEKPLTSPTRQDNYTVSFHALPHPGGSVGYRIDWPDKSLAFITDTTANTDLDYVDFIRGVDLLIHECNFPDGQEELAETTGHSCLTPVIQVAKKSEVGALVLVHFNPLMARLEADDVIRAEEFFSPIVLAEDGMEFDF